MTIPNWAANIRLYEGQTLILIEGGALVHDSEHDTYAGYSLMSNGSREYLGVFKSKRDASYEVLRGSKRNPL